MKRYRGVSYKVTSLMIIVTVFCYGAFANAQGAAESTTQSEPDAVLEGNGGVSLPGTAILTPGILGGEDYFEGRLDFLAPLLKTKDGNGMLLGNMRTAFGDEGEQELNAGLLYRHYISDYNSILGANIFYDGRWTRRDSQFNQMGLGIECLTAWVDARANVYLPEQDKDLISREENTVLESYSDVTTYDDYTRDNQIREHSTTVSTRNYRTDIFELYETPLKGYDAEIGFKLPFVSTDNLEARLFAGYYDFEPKWTGNVASDNQISGAKGRLEIRAWNSVFLNAEIYEDDALYGSEYLLSFNIRLPLGKGALKDTFGGDRNAWRGGETGPLLVSQRMMEMAIRDPQVQIRNEISDRDVFKTETSRKERDYLLYDDVIFVYGDNAADLIENGSALHPFDVIQEGVDASGERNMPNVYVYGASNPYRENIDVDGTSIRLMGEGMRVGNGDAPSHGHGRPVIEGQADSLPSVIMAQNACSVAIGGFEITAAPHAGGVLPEHTFGPMVGIMADDVVELDIRENKFRNLAAGVVSIYQGVEAFDHTIAYNQFDNTGIGVGALYGSKGTARIGFNTIQDSILGVGVAGIAMTGRANVEIGGNSIGGDTVDLAGILPFDFFVDMIGVPADHPATLPIPTVGGVLALALPDSDMKVSVFDNTINQPALGIAGAAIAPVSTSPAILDFEVSGNTLVGGGLDTTYQLLVDHVDPTHSVLPATLGVDGGLLGVGALSMGAGGQMNATIANNSISDYMIGIGAISAAGGQMNDALISHNNLKGNIVGAFGLAIADAEMKNLTITGNTIAEANIGSLNPLLESLGVPSLSDSTVPMQLPEIGLAGIGVVGLFDANLDGFTITGNTVNDNLLGIGVLASEGATANGGQISGNVLNNNILGIAGISLYKAEMHNLDISENTVIGGGALGAIDGILGGDPLASAGFDPGLAGIAVVGTRTDSLDDFTIQNNQVANHFLGIAVLSDDAGNSWGGDVSNNDIADNEIPAISLDLNTGNQLPLAVVDIHDNID